MRKILVSGNVNLETNLPVGNFPLNYSPVRYVPNEIKTNVGGVAYNVSKALATLGDSVSLVAMLGADPEGDRIRKTLFEDNINISKIKNCLSASPVSVVMRDSLGQRAIYTDTKDLQLAKYDFSTLEIHDFDMVVACNVNFNRELLHRANKAGIPVATDVHVLSDPYDSYNQEFMQYADIIFLSDEALWIRKREFIEKLRDAYPAKIIVIGCGKAGALIYIRDENAAYRMDAVKNDYVVNTLGAGDALFSSFLHFYSNGQMPLEALKRAQIFASHKISYNGASSGFITDNEVEDISRQININVTRCW